MAIISFDADAVVAYVPNYGDNRNDDNPCIIKLKYVPYSRVQHYARILSAKTQNEKDSTRIVEMSQDIQKKQFTDNVEGISGYFIGDREVTSVEEFYSTADTDFILEVIRAMESQQKLSEGQIKNS